MPQITTPTGIEMLVDKNVVIGPGALVAIDELRGRSAFANLHKLNEKSTAEASIEMRDLVKQSVVEGTHIRLQVARSGKRHFLRWKYRNLAVTWEALHPHLIALPAPVRKHYEQLQRRVLELNAISRMFEGVRNEIQKLMQQAGWTATSATANVPNANKAPASTKK
jgi:hypothetical protein